MPILKRVNLTVAKAVFVLGLGVLLPRIPAQVAPAPSPQIPPQLQQAQKGDASAELQTGLWYNSGISGQIDSKEAGRWFKRASKHGSADATAMLGSLYLYGHGVATDRARAYQLVQTSVGQGSLKGKVLLAQMYMRGWHVTQDHAKAHELLMSVGDKEPLGLTMQAIMELHGPEKHPAKAVELFSRAARAGESSAMLSLGEMYLFGAGIQQDFDQAAVWFKKAVRFDNRAAEFRLGQMYAKGVSVPKNQTQAYALFQRAAEQGYVPAQTLCGTYNFYGFGIAKDRVRAYYWFSTAAAYSSAAKNWLDRVSSQLTPQELKIAAAMTARSPVMPAN